MRWVAYGLIIGSGAGIMLIQRGYVDAALDLLMIIAGAAIVSALIIEFRK